MHVISLVLYLHRSGLGSPILWSLLSVPAVRGHSRLFVFRMSSVHITLHPSVMIRTYILKQTHKYR